MVRLPFVDRADAARQLAAALAEYQGQRPVVLAIPRGGVPVGQVLAEALGGELDVVLVRKIGAPFNPELAIGAVDEHGQIELNAHAGRYGEDGYIRDEAARQLAVIRERRQQYGAAAPLSLDGRVVIVVDDGLATGSTMQAALDAVRKRGPAKLVCAVPIGAADTVKRLSKHADRVVCLASPPTFGAVGYYYRDFASVNDAEVMRILRQARSQDAANAARGITVSTVRIPTGQLRLEGELALPAQAQGIVVFAHGTGSSRHSPRNHAVAAVLQRAGFATLLFDLLDAEEDTDRSARFDIKRLAQRLSAAIDWVREQPNLVALPIGLFGTSTGAAAALRVAAQRPNDIAALVSRGGRADLAGPVALPKVVAPTLLIVGSNDVEVASVNRVALGTLPRAQLELLPRAGHLFEEPGVLDKVAELARDWFARWLPAGRD